MPIPKNAISGIYKIYWNENDYFYFGQAIHIKERIGKHLRLLKIGKHSNIKLQHIYNKYGIPVYDIVERCLNFDLDNREQHYIDVYFKDDNCCNLSPTASSNKGVKFSEETKLKISKKSLGRYHTEETKRAIGDKQRGALNHSFGKKLTDEHKAKISPLGRKQKAETKIKIGNRHRGKIVSEETRNKLRKRNTGKMATEETKKKMSKARIGKPVPYETRIKMSNTHKGKKMSAEACIKNGIAHSGEKSGVAKLVLNTETGIFYWTIREAWASIGRNTVEYLGYRLRRPDKNNTSFILV